MQVRPDQVVRTEWVSIDACLFGCRERMDAAAVERAYRRYLQAGDTQFWPPIVGHRRGPVLGAGARFVVNDGRHEFCALLMLGRERVFVAWLEDIDAVE